MYAPYSSYLVFDELFQVEDLVGDCESLRDFVGSVLRLIL